MTTIEDTLSSGSSSSSLSSSLTISSPKNKPNIILDQENKDANLLNESKLNDETLERSILSSASSIDSSLFTDIVNEEFNNNCLNDDGLNNKRTFVIKKKNQNDSKLRQPILEFLEYETNKLALDPNKPIKDTQRVLLKISINL